MNKTTKWVTDFEQFNLWCKTQHRFPSTKDTVEYSWIRKQIKDFNSGKLSTEQIEKINSISHYILHPMTKNSVREVTDDIQNKRVALVAPDFANNKTLTLDEKAFLVYLGLTCDRDVINYLLKMPHNNDCKSNRVIKIKKALGFKIDTDTQQRVNEKYILGLFSNFDSSYRESVIDMIEKLTGYNLWDMFILPKAEFNPNQLCIRALSVLEKVRTKIDNKGFEAAKLVWAGNNSIKHTASYLASSEKSIRASLNTILDIIKKDENAMKYLLNGETLSIQEQIEIKRRIGLPIN